MNKEYHPIFDSTALPSNLEIDDAGIISEFYEEFLVQLQELKRVLSRSGPAVANRNEVAQFAHRLKSSSEAVGARQLSNSLRLLEQASVNNTPEFNAVFSTAKLLIEPTSVAIHNEMIRLGRAF